MILEKQKDALILDEGEVSQQSIEMSLDLDSEWMLMQMLSKNLYSDGIGSTVRELASNALDSHTEADTDKPIIVTFKPNANGSYEFTVEDFGTGLDNTDVTNIISKYGKSTRRKTANALGMMGLGFKAPLAYCSSFYFIVRKNGIERKYVMYEGEEKNSIDLLHEKLTDQPNGVKIIVPVETKDANAFIVKIKEQLAYFEGVYFDVPGVDSTKGIYNYSTNKWEYHTPGISNGFLIHRGEDFQMSEIMSTDKLHICLGNVCYPIDFTALKIPEIKIPVGLKFGLSDGIFPTPNRETIRYTQESKQIILDKLTVVANYFMNKYNEKIHDMEDVSAVMRYYNSTERYIVLNNKSYNCTDIFKYATVRMATPKIKGVNLINLKLLADNNGEGIFDEYNIKYEINRGVMRGVNNEYLKINLNTVSDNNIYIYEDTISGNMKEYLKETISNAIHPYFIKKVKEYDEMPVLNKNHYHSDNSYYTILGLSKFPKSQWNDVIAELHHIRDLFLAKFTKVDDIVIPKSWLDARKKVKNANNPKYGRTDENGKRIIKLKGEIVGKEAVGLERYVEGRNCKFVPMTYKLEEIPVTPNLFVYTLHDNSINLDPLYGIMKQQKVKFITFSERETKVVASGDIHNLISYEEFMKGKNQPFKRVVTARLIHMLMVENENIFNKIDKLKGISDSLYMKLQDLKDYDRKHYQMDTNGMDDTYEKMIKIAEKNNMYDGTIYHLYTEVKALLKRLKFLEPVLSTMSNYRSSSETDAKLLDVIVDLFKRYKFRLNYTQYRAGVPQPQHIDEIVEKLAS